MAIKFGSEVYTWFMDGYGEGNDNQLPHMAKQHFARHHFACMVHQIAKQLELLGREREVATLAKGGARLHMAFEVAEQQYRIMGGAAAPFTAPSPPHRASAH